MGEPLAAPSRAEAPHSTAAWWHHAGWYRAVTLTERRASRGPDGDPPARNCPWKTEQAERQLQHWKRQTPFQHGSWFADRLAADGLTEQDLLLLLAEPPEALQARLALPEWFYALRQAFEVETPAADLPLPAPDETSPLAHAEHARCGPFPGCRDESPRRKGTAADGSFTRPLAGIPILRREPEQAAPGPEQMKQPQAKHIQQESVSTFNTKRVTPKGAYDVSLSL